MIPCVLDFKAMQRISGCCNGYTQIIQDCWQRKLIVYFDTWISLDKALNMEFNFKKFKGVWTRYFLFTLNWLKNRPPKKTDST
ncbi:hypothetical protein RhiirB3_446518 [Rhizophagus irregularis]|nr:hypothetical protein RhiirB3_446518 [Rhizophagus irregularis]